MTLFRTIRGRMILCYTTIIIVVVCAFSGFYYHYTSDILEERASDALHQRSINTNATMDARVENMDAIANRINSSSLVKAAFYVSPDSQLGQLENKREMMQVLFNVTGSKVANPVNLIGTDGKYVEYGRTFDVSFLSADPFGTAPWFQACLAMEGRMYITPPHISAWGGSDRMVMSLCRAFNPSFGEPYDAVVEVLTDYDTFALAVEAAVRPDKVQALVFNRDGTQIYPLEGDSSVYYQETLGAKSGTFPMESDGQREIVAYSRSDYTGMTVVMCEEESQLLAPVTAFRNRLILFGSLILLITITITFLLAKQLTEPIRKIQKSISALDLGELRSEDASAYQGSAYELTRLNHAYVEMVDRLQRSLDETLNANSREVEARMLALQAQMNPHFLYNTITVISIKAEDSGDQDVVRMCEALSSMLRYVAKEAPAFVPMEEELVHLRQYLYLMSCRYPDQFEAAVAFPPELSALPVPKLILQPLVENCFKHGFHRRSPWKIRVEGSCDETTWQVSVTDNGVGFSDEALALLEETFAVTRGDFTRGGPDGIGLGNMFHRLKYRYRDKAVFSIQNLPEGGCRITIGGTREGAEQHAL